MSSFKLGKLALGFLVYSFTIVVIVTLAGMLWLSHEFRRPGPLTSSTLFEVERGMSLNNIGFSLYAEKAVHDPFIFIIGTMVSGAQGHLKAGEYELQPAMSAQQIMNLLREGTTFGRRFTIREGLTSYEIVQLLNGIEELSGEIVEIPPEGTLLPNTYDYRLGEDRGEIIARLGESMATIEESFLKNLTLKEPLKSWSDVIILASIVEKETGQAGERKRVAGVFINRLKRGIPLQTDPTVIYALTKGKHKNDGRGPLGRRLLRKDLEIDSPYNTYKYPGLPPGPIANPGRAAIEAVLDPEAHDYIYFVADGAGGHVFAKTLAEHNRNVANWRKIRKKSRL